MERPTEFEALEWDVMRKGQDEWLQGHNADKWSNYPDAIDGKVLIGERTLFIRPEWEWPREERFRGLTNGEAINQDELDSNFDLTYEMYAAGHGQGDHQLVISNAERQLIGPAYRWVGINANLAHALGWRLCDDVPFQWVDRAGKVMIQSKYWKNGWIWIEPPRFEALGEGWMVLAAPEAIDDIRRIAPGAELHLWVERRSHGDGPCQGRWHLNRQLGCDKNA